MAFHIGDIVLRKADCCSAEGGMSYAVRTNETIGHGMGIGKEASNLCSCLEAWILVSCPHQTIGTATSTSTLSINTWDNITIPSGTGDYIYLSPGTSIFPNTIKSKPTMSIFEKFKSLIATEPNKTFIKAGIMDSNGRMNGDGRELFVEFLINKFGPEFKTEVVDKIVAEDEKNKC